MTILIAYIRTASYWGHIMVTAAHQVLDESYDDKQGQWILITTSKIFFYNFHQPVKLCAYDTIPYLRDMNINYNPQYILCLISYLTLEQVRHDTPSSRRLTIRPNTTPAHRFIIAATEIIRWVLSCIDVLNGSIARALFYRLHWFDYSLVTHKTNGCSTDFRLGRDNDCDLSCRGRWLLIPQVARS